MLDTNTCIQYLNRRVDSIVQRLDALEPADVVVCAVTRAELWSGAEKSNTRDTTLAKQEAFLKPFATLSFDDQAARHYARIRAALEKRGTPIGPNDLLIASIALTYNLILVTHNTAEFSGIDGLIVEDWENPLP